LCKSRSIIRYEVNNLMYRVMEDMLVECDGDDEEE
jgi:hypothetical protein